MQLMSGAKASLERYGPFRLDIDSEIIELYTNDFSVLRYEPILMQVKTIIDGA